LKFLDPFFGPICWTHLLDPLVGPTCWTHLLDQFVGHIFWTHFLDTFFGHIFWTNLMKFLTNILMNILNIFFFSVDFSLTFNILTIASFKIGVPAILFFCQIAMCSSRDSVVSRIFVNPRSGHAWTISTFTSWKIAASAKILWREQLRPRIRRLSHQGASITSICCKKSTAFT
jgi:hypothetical protein